MKQKMTIIAKSYVFKKNVCWNLLWVNEIYYMKNCIEIILKIKYKQNIRSYIYI